MSNPFIKNPSNAIANANSSLTLSALVRDDPNLTYQWSYSTQTGVINPTLFEDLPGATGSSVTLPNASLWHLNWFVLKVTDTILARSFTSSPVQVGAYPTNVSVTGLPLYVYAKNLEANLEIYPSSSYNYVWQQKGVEFPNAKPNLSSYVSFASGDANKIKLTGLSMSNHNTQYRVAVVDNNVTGWISPPITLVVDPNINILQNNLTDFTVPNNGNKQLSVVARASNGNIVYSWQKAVDDSEFTDIPGEDKNYLNLVNLTTNNVGEKYRAKLVSSISKIYTKYSSVANIINPSFGAQSSSSIQITGQSSGNINITQTGVGLFVLAQSDAPLSYQWYKSEDKVVYDSIPGATGSSLDLAFNGFEDKIEYYKYKVSNSGNSIFSQPISLDRNTKTRIVNHPSGISVVSSGNISSTFFVNQTGLYDYEWYRAPLSGYNVWIRVNDSGNISQISDNIFESSLSLTGLNVLNNDKDAYFFVAKNKNTKKIEFVSKKAYIDVMNTIVVNSGLPDIIRIPINESGSLSVNVSSSAPPLSYQWYKSTDSGLNFVPITGAISSSLALNNLVNSDNKTYYRVQISDTANTLILPDNGAPL